MQTYNKIIISKFKHVFVNPTPTSFCPTKTPTEKENKKKINNTQENNYAANNISSEKHDFTALSYYTFSFVSVNSPIW